MKGAAAAAAAQRAPGRRERDLSSLRLAVTGAAVVPVSLIEQMRAALGALFGPSCTLEEFHLGQKLAAMRAHATQITVDGGATNHQPTLPRFDLASSSTAE